MRILGRLAVAAGATAAVLLAAPAANAATDTDLKHLAEVVGQGETRAVPLPAVGGLVNSVPIANQVISKLVGGLVNSSGASAIGG
ncbi:hypothetical protein [Saccharothrix hoggarensis]|uniref:Small secreted domain DUF320 n=1 Tax=Saccharothrix hoggarensis TaxID=913853 RepID=A0ABW3QW59_9PSEU